MIIRTKNKKQPLSSEITSEKDYLSRRRFLKTAGYVGAAAALAACAPSVKSIKPTPMGVEATIRDEFGDISTPFDYVSGYNNFYEFTTDKEGVAPMSAGFTTEPWQVEVGGLVNNPRTFGLEDILKEFDQEERVLPASMRGGVVYGDPLGGIFSLQPPEESRTDIRR